MITAEPAQRRRGRPRTIGDLTCDRCGRVTAKIRVAWPDGRICGICYHEATRTTGSCDQCGEHRLLPGRDGNRRLCTRCAGITTTLTCDRCGTEGERYRRGICARCALRDDLTLMAPAGAPSTTKANSLIDALCSVDRPESIHTWKRNPDVQRLLADILSSAVPLDHAGIDATPAGRAREHLRQLLIHTQLLAQRDPDLAHFEGWIADRLARIDDRATRRTVERFATWHHLGRIRRRVSEGHDVHGAVHTAKQEISEAARFLIWLSARATNIGNCTQANVEEWLTGGPTTRTTIQAFLVWAANNKTCRRLKVPRRFARSTQLLDHDDRMRLLRTCLVGEPETLGYRVAAVLLLLYAQPLTRLVRLSCADIAITPTGVTITLGVEPAAVPEPLATMLSEHLANRPNMRTVNAAGNPWLFPGGRAGRHLTAQAAPWRSTPRSAIESAPATIRATTAVTLAPGACPAPLGTVRNRSDNSPRPARTANATAGTSPAWDTKVGSSNTTDRTGNA